MLAMMSDIKGPCKEPVVQTVEIEITEADRHPIPSWRPQMLRLPGATLFIFCLLATVAMLEVAVRLLPHQVQELPSDSLLNKTSNAISNAISNLPKRQLETNFQTLSFEVETSGSPLTATLTVSGSNTPATQSLPESSTSSEGITVGHPAPSDEAVDSHTIPPATATTTSSGFFNLPPAPSQDPALMASNSHSAAPPAPVTPGAVTSTVAGMCTPAITPPASVFPGMETKHLTFTAIANSQNPFYNARVIPQEYRSTNNVQYGISVVFPKWAEFLGSGAFAVAVLSILKLLWTVFHSQIALIEPFTHLSSSNGALCKQALFSKYTNHSLLLGPLNELRSRRWVIFLASMTAFSTLFLPSLASEVLITNTRDCICSPPSWKPGTPNPCPSQLVVDVQSVRPLQALLCLIATIVALVTLLVRRKPTGIAEDPSSVGAVASLLHHPEAVNTFRSMPPYASTAQAVSIIGERRMKLGNYSASNGAVRYGLMPVADSAPSNYNSAVTSSNSERLLTTVLAWLPEAALIVLLTGLLGVIAAYYKAAGTGNKFNVFMNSDTFGPRFVLTSAGSVIGLLWRGIFTEVNTKSVFTRLEKGAARADRTILATRNSISATTIFPSLFRGQFLVSAVALCDVLVQIMVIVLPAIPFRSSQTKEQYTICSKIAMAILAALLVVLAMVMVWRRKGSSWPQQPETVAAIMSFVVDSDLHKHMADHRSDSEKENECSTIREKLWCFKPCLGPDGKSRWSVVEDGSSRTTSHMA